VCFQSHGVSYDGQYLYWVETADGHQAIARAHLENPADTREVNHYAIGYSSDCICSSILSAQQPIERVPPLQWNFLKHAMKY
jgi:hypothetical protein